MEKLSVHLQNCFGISAFDYEFKFDDSNVYAIYAKNGTMKTSFAKTFDKISKDKKREIKDVIFETAGIVDVKCDENEIKPEDVFVINSFVDSYESDVSQLLVDDAVKEKLKTVLKCKNNFFRTLEKRSGLKIKATRLGKPVYELEPQIIKDLDLLNDSFLMNVNNIDLSNIEFECPDIEYTSVFDSSVIKKINTEEFQNGIDSFNNEVDTIYKANPFFKKGCFTLSRLKSVKKNLDKDHYFSSGNTITLKGQSASSNIEDVNNIILGVEDAVSKTASLAALEKMLSDAGGMLLKEVIENYPEVVPYLKKNKLETLRRCLWQSYLKKENQLFTELKLEYAALSSLIESVTIDGTQWKKALDTFNERFSVPFEMQITNLKGSIIGESVPHVEFKFEKDDYTKSIDRNHLEEANTLSQGEKRALYLLNIIFDIQRLNATRNDVLYIVDDIADSFDYKNKYAIVEYLYDLAQDDKNKLIILSHNFDFYRTVSSRLGIKRNHRLVAQNDGSLISLIKEKYQKQPFEYWKKNTKRKFILALIPFVRNIVEFGRDRNICGKESDFLYLTSLLHEKADTYSIKYGDILPLYQEYIGVNAFQSEVDSSESVVVSLYVECDNLENSNNELEDKVLLSIAIRHLTEKFILRELALHTATNVSFEDQGAKKSDSVGNFLASLANQTNQTTHLIEVYRQVDSTKNELMDKVKIMTPENIHLNSFMYEPILDMDINELLSLYNHVKML